MNRSELISKVEQKKIIAIVRGVYADDCVKLAQALYAGGIELMEVTFDQSQPERLTRTSDTVHAVKEAMDGQMVLGAGTVTSAEMVTLAHEAGASFIVSPDVNKAVIERTRTLDMVSMPGAMTPTEILTAHSYGADFVKVFPTSNLGASYIKAIRGPINHVKLLAVGGVNEKNIAEFLAAGVVGAGVGGNLVNKTWIAEGAFDRITALAKEFVRNCNGKDGK